MTDSRKSKLSFEILGDLAVSLAAAVCLFCLLVFLALHIADSFVYSQNIEMTDIDIDYMTSRCDFAFHTTKELYDHLFGT